MVSFSHCQSVRNGAGSHGGTGGTRLLYQDFGGIFCSLGNGSNLCKRALHFHQHTKSRHGHRHAYLSGRQKSRRFDRLSPSGKRVPYFKSISVYGQQLCLYAQFRRATLRPPRSEPGTEHLLRGALRR